MVLTLYGSSAAPCTKIVATVLQEKQVPFKLVEINLVAQEHKSSAYLEKQPFGQIPCLDDEGYLIYESRAISRYIEEKYPNQGTTLIPKELKAKGIFEQAASVEHSNFYPYATQAVKEVVFKKIYGLEPDLVAYASAIKTLEEKLDVYEQILAKQKYIAGDEFTLVDIFHLPWCALVRVAGSKAIDERPNVARWANAIAERPSWRFVKDGVVSTA